MTFYFHNELFSSDFVLRSNGTQYEGFDSSSDSSSVDSLRPEDIESDANQVTTI